MLDAKLAFAKTNTITIIIIICFERANGKWYRPYVLMCCRWCVHFAARFILNIAYFMTLPPKQRHFDVDDNKTANETKKLSAISSVNMFAQMLVLMANMVKVTKRAHVCFCVLRQSILKILLKNTLSVNCFNVQFSFFWHYHFNFFFFILFSISFSFAFVIYLRAPWIW